MVCLPGFVSPMFILREEHTDQSARYVTAIAVCLVLLIWGIYIRFTHDGEQRRAVSPSTILSLGFGETNPLTFINWSTDRQGLGALFSNAFLANVPQVILSAIYFTYNGIFTNFQLAIEWNQYSIKRKSLRVSSKPKRAQRSTYFLQLPYRFALPLMALSGLLHWLTSQSIFVVSVLLLSNTDVDQNEFLSVGYSPSAIIGVIVVGVFMIVALAVAGGRRLRGRIPLASVCSAAISAACHIPTLSSEDGLDDIAPSMEEATSTKALLVTEERDKTHGAAFSALKWGVTTPATMANPLGHCALSDKEVGEPEEGVRYA